MKLILSIINKDDANFVSDALTNAGFPVTKLSTTGGFLKVGNTTFITGVDDDKVDEVVSIVKSNSSKRTQDIPSASLLELNMYSSAPFKINIGGAIIFILNVEKFEKF